MTASYGWAGKVLRVDLTERDIEKIPTSGFEPEKYIGGLGLNTKMFWEMGCPDVDAFHPDSPLMIANGPLSGASGPFSRGTVCAIAPQSYPRELFTYSSFGGKFSAELKYAGYDAIAIVGKADKPCYLCIQDGDVTIEDAGELWGLDTFETQNILGNRYARSSSLVMGPAGENLSRIAIILNDGSGAAGQGGYGGVMGAKNLKAIVARGTGTVKLAKPDEFMELFRQRKADGDWEIGALAWARKPQGGERIQTVMRDNHLVKYAGCHGCPIQCNGVYDVPGIGKGSEMCNDTWYNFFNGDDKMGRNIESGWEGNILTQKLGINTFEIGSFISFLFATIGGGILTKEDFGLSAIPFMERRNEPEFGGTQAHMDFLHEFLNGLADGSSPLSDGVLRGAEKFGSRALEIAEQINPAWGMRNHQLRGVGEVLQWALDTRDPFNSSHDYVIGFGDNKEIADWYGLVGGYLEGESEGKHQNVYKGTEHLTAWVQNHQCLKNSLTMCEFPSMPGRIFHPPEMDVRIFESRCFSFATGLDVDADQLWESGERIHNLRRAVAVKREDRHRDDDTICDSIFSDSIKLHGPEKTSEAIDRGKWEALRDRYYQVRGWNVDTGRPQRPKLESLGMKDVADGLEIVGRLG